MSITVANRNKYNKKVAQLLVDNFSGKDFDLNQVLDAIKSASIPFPKFKVNDPNKPKCCRTAYIYFTNSVRDQVSKDNPDLTMTQLSPIFSKMWSDLDDKSEFNDLATKDKERYDKEMTEWKNSKVSSDEEDDSDTSSSKNSKKSTKKKHPDAPKKPTTAYFYFCEVTRANDTDTTFTTKKGVDNSLSDMWADIKGTDDASQFVDMATADKERYAKEMTEWKAKNA